MDKIEQSDIKRAVLEALGDNYGIISEATKKGGIARSTFYEWLKNDPDFKVAVDEIQEEAIDFVEGKLFERINGVEVVKGYDKDGNEIIYSLPPDVQAIGLYLKTRGKKRGYVERTEVSPVDPDGNAVQPIININVIRTKKEIDDSL